MDKHSRLTSLTHLGGGEYRKGLDYYPSKGVHKVNIHKIIDFHNDMEATLTALFDDVKQVLVQHPVDVQKDGDRVATRGRDVLGTTKTLSDIVMIDVDNVNGEDIIPIGDNLQEQLENFMTKHFSIELLGAEKVIRMSSSYYTKGAFKFHCYFKLSKPVSHGSWVNYITDGHFEHADMALFRNSAQLVYTAKPVGKLVNPEVQIFTFTGHSLCVDTSKYTPTPPSSRSENVKHLPNIKLKPIDEHIIAKLDNLDMSSGSRYKLFDAYRTLDAMGYDITGTTLPSMEAQVSFRPNKLHYLTSQPSWATNWVHGGCVDKYDKEVTYLDNHLDAFIDFSNLKKNGNYRDDDEDNQVPIELNWCKAPTGTGKTVGLNDFRKRKGDVLIAAPTLVLVGANAKDFNGIEVNGMCDTLEASHNGNVSTTIHSLHKLAYAAKGSAFNVVVIDEASQCLDALLNIPSLERRDEIIETLIWLFRFADYVVLCDADLTETVISNYELLLERKVSHNRMHIAKSNDLATQWPKSDTKVYPVKQRVAYMYESTNEVLAQLRTSLENNKRCLIIVNSKILLRRIRRIHGNNAKSYFFTSDNYGEPTMEEFKNNPKKFVAARKPKLLACTQLLKSGVSFVGQFDEVFIVDFSSSNTDRLIGQMITRERAWETAHIYTNTINTSIQKCVSNPTKFDIALSVNQRDLRDQLLIRPKGVAYRLAGRGVDVTFVPSLTFKIQLEDKEVPRYCKTNEDGRSSYEEYVFNVNNNGNLSTHKNVLMKYGNLIKAEGGEDAISAWQSGKPIAFYEWVQKNQILKKDMGNHFNNFKASLKSYGLSDDGYFDYLIDEGIRPSDFGRDKTLLSRTLKGFVFSLNHLKKAKELSLIHRHVMKEIDDIADCQLEKGKEVDDEIICEEGIKIIYGEIHRA